jgi:tetratricopeptide (TPR) repeat protein
MHPEELRTSLFAAIAARDGNRFVNLVNEYSHEIIRNFRTWQKVPESARDDPAAVRAWGNALITIARAFESAGITDLMQALAGNDEGNPLVRWEDGLRRAQQLTGSGAASEGITILERILREMAGAKGTAVDRLRPKVLGACGAAYFEREDFDRAKDATQAALQECRRLGDEAGIRSYLENLQILWAVLLPQSDPELGRKVHACREAIVNAQRLSDEGRYERSMDVLQKALLQSDGLQAERLADYRGKVCGLLGWNEYHQRDFAAAEEWTRRAIDACSHIGDITGSRIYLENLETIRKAAGHPRLERGEAVNGRTPKPSS